MVELYEYPLGAKEPNDYQKMATDEDWHPVVKSGVGNGRDRVIILEDTDNDGKADKRTVFLEGLSLATAILCGYDGVFIGQAPNLFSSAIPMAMTRPTTTKRCSPALDWKTGMSC